MAGGLSLFCGLGVAALVVGPLWAISRISATVPELPFGVGAEDVLYQAAANHFLGGEARGGRIFLTRTFLGFRPHRFNVQLDTWQVPLSQITGAHAEGSRLVVVDAAEPAHSGWLVVMDARQLAGYLTEVIATEQAGTNCGQSSASLKQLFP